MTRRVRLLLIILAAMLVYSNTFSVPFLIDDIDNIVRNPAMRDFSFFTDPVLIDKTDASGNVKSYLRSRMATYLTFALNYRMSPANKPFGYHAVNLAVHTGSAIAIYFIVITLFRAYKREGEDAAFIAALLFAVHPMGTQAVTYISQRFAALAALFYLLTFLLYLKIRLERDRKNLLFFYTLSLGAALLAFKSKENAFTLPLALTLFDFMFVRDKARGRAMFLLPYFIMALIVPVSFLITPDGAGLTRSVGDVMEAGRNFAPHTHYEYLISQPRALVTYMRLLLLPMGQNIAYFTPANKVASDIGVILPLITLVMVIVLGAVLYRRSSKGGGAGFHMRVCAFGIFWFFVTVAVEAGLVPLVEVINEYRAYLPSVGIFIAVAATFSAMKITYPRFGIWLTALALGAVVAYGIAGYGRNMVWADAVSIWEDSAGKSPNAFWPHHNLGAAYDEAGQIDRAISEYSLAARLKPDFSHTRYNLGVAYMKKGMLDQAVIELTETVKIDPAYYDAYYFRALSHRLRGEIDLALADYGQVARLRPGAADAYLQMADIYRLRGEYDKAIGYYRAVLDIEPANKMATVGIERVIAEKNKGG